MNSLHGRSGPSVYAVCCINVGGRSGAAVLAPSVSLNLLMVSARGASILRSLYTLLYRWVSGARKPFRNGRGCLLRLYNLRRGMRPCCRCGLCRFGLVKLQKFSFGRSFFVQNDCSGSTISGEFDLVCRSISALRTFAEFVVPLGGRLCTAYLPSFSWP